jgi:hypothetical protein
VPIESERGWVHTEKMSVLTEIAGKRHILAKDLKGCLTLLQEAHKKKTVRSKNI